MLKFLIEAFKASKGRMPNNMEMILLRQKAAKQSIDERKVVSMFDRSAVNPNKPILGGKNIPETEEEIRQRILKNNEEGIASMKKKLNEPEERAMGGRIGYKDGEGVITIDDKIDEMISFYKDYLNQGGKMDFKTFSKKYIPQNFADGGRIGRGGGGTMGASDKGYQGGGRDKKGNVSGTAPGAAAVGGGPDDRGNDRQNAVQAMVRAGYTPKEINRITNPNVIDRVRDSRYNNPVTRGILRAGAYTLNPSIGALDFRKAMQLKDLYNYTVNQINNPVEEDFTLGGIGGINTSMLKDSPYENMVPQFKADGGRIGYKIGSGKKGVQSLLDLVRDKFGKKAATTADKAPIPLKTLDRDMFKKFDNRNPDPKRQLTDEEIEEYEMELGDTETWMNDGTVGEAEAALKNHREYMADIMRMKERGDFGDFSPSKLDNVNDEQIAAAVDDIFPTGDPKYDAEMASEALVENNPQIFGDNVLLDDLDDATRSKIYGAVYDVLSNNMAKMRELKKLSKPEKTLQSMKEGKGIDISDPEIADEFTRFMKEKDPKAYKELEQKIELSNFKTKDRKGNADGGRIGLKAGMTKRGFLKLMGSVGAGIGAAKSGIFSGFGKGAGKKVAKEVVQSAGSGTPPPYFFKLADKIKKFGDDVTPKYSTQERQVVKEYKDYQLTEDMGTGKIEISKKNFPEGDEAVDYFGEPLMEDVYMSYKPGEMLEGAGGKVLKSADEYIEDTAYVRSSGPQTGDISSEMDGIAEGTFKKIIKDIDEAPSIKIKKASGGIARMLGE